MIPVIAGAALTAASFVGLVVADRLHSKAAVWIAKPLASAGFVGAAIAGGAASHPPGQAILVALLLSFAGDVLLIPRTRKLFLAGLGSFLLGHLAYAVAFLIRGVDPVYSAAALAVLLPLGWWVSRWLRPHLPQGMVIPVHAYIAVITAMVACAAGGLRTEGGPLMFVAAVAFFLSDLAVARDRFVRPGLINRALGLPFYYGAQLLFAYAASAP